MDVAVVIVPSSAPGVRVEEDKRRPNEKIIFLWTRNEGSVGDGSLAMDDNINDNIDTTMDNAAVVVLSSAPGVWDEAAVDSVSWRRLCRSRDCFQFLFCCCI